MVTCDTLCLHSVTMSCHHLWDRLCHSYHVTIYITRVNRSWTLKRDPATARAAAHGSSSSGHTLSHHTIITPTHPHPHTLKELGKGVLQQQEQPHRDLRRASTHTISHSTLIRHTDTHSYTIKELGKEVLRQQEQPHRDVHRAATWESSKGGDIHALSQHTHMTHPYTLIHAKEMGKGSCYSKSGQTGIFNERTHTQSLTVHS